MKHFLKQIVYLVPIILLVGTLLSMFIPFNYVLIGNILGYSVIANIPLIYHFYFGPYCWLTRYSTLGLMAVNLIDIVGVFIYYEVYSRLFNISICVIILTLALVFEIKKRLAYD